MEFSARRWRRRCCRRRRCRRWTSTAFVWSVAAAHFANVKRSTGRTRLSGNNHVCTKRSLGRVVHTATRTDNRLAFAVADGWRSFHTIMQLAVKQRCRLACVMISDEFGAARITYHTRFAAVVLLEFWRRSFRLADDRRCCWIARSGNDSARRSNRERHYSAAIDNLVARHIAESVYDIVLVLSRTLDRRLTVDRLGFLVVPRTADGVSLRRSVGGWQMCRRRRCGRRQCRCRLRRQLTPRRVVFLTHTRTVGVVAARRAAQCTRATR